MRSAASGMDEIRLMTCQTPESINLWRFAASSSVEHSRLRDQLPQAWMTCQVT